VEVEFSRGDDRRKVEIPVFERPDLPDRLARLMDRARTSVPALGIMAADIAEETMEELPFFRDSQGVLVAAHMPGSLSRNSLQPGDLIHAVNTVPLRNLADLTEDLAKRRKGDIVYLSIERQLQYRYVIVEIQ
jgi:serine protease Do